MRRLRPALLTAALLGAAPALHAQAPPAPEPLVPAPASDGDLLVVTPEQAAAVERGLAWLADHQNADGSWTAKIGYKLNNDYNYTSENNGHVGVTSLACMAFLAGGHLPGRGKYGECVEKGLAFVLDSVTDDGYITRQRTRMYSHAFATLFLAEVYGTTRREDVRQKLQRAVDWIVESQNREGGWRYEPFAPESDMSIVVCQVLALRAARNIGIRVPKATVDRAAQYVVDSAVTQEQGLGYGHPAFSGAEVGTFRYQKDVYSRSSFPLTAAGVTALHGLGIYSDEAIERGIAFLTRELPRFNKNEGVRKGGHYFFWYGHYYGVQAMYTVGSPYWEPYFEEVRELLLSMQNEDGSFPNRTGPGPAFGTAMGVLILEIPYRFLPIFQR
ncbi:MAG: terpene cyclase/mutase family protein [Planctomycetes bacterium]|nr:terpene cyclase/mutase family protein [Planctomycetota bacterium]